MQEEKNSKSIKMDEQSNKYLCKNVFFGDPSESKFHQNDGKGRCAGGMRSEGDCVERVNV